MSEGRLQWSQPTAGRTELSLTPTQPQMGRGRLRKVIQSTQTARAQNTPRHDWWLNRMSLMLTRDSGKGPGLGSCGALSGAVRK